MKAAKAKIAAENLGITLHEPSGSSSAPATAPADPGVVACPACHKTSDDAWLGDNGQEAHGVMVGSVNDND